MLLLSRKNNEQIVINGNISIKVLSIRGNSVRLGIDAPATVPVVRAELVEKRTDLTPDQPPVLHLLD